MKTKINIFDLCWCCLYLHEKRYFAGVPFVGSSVSMAIFLTMYIEGIVFLFPRAIGLHVIRDTSVLSIDIVFGLLFVFFILRHRKKNVREERLARYQKYKDETPQKAKFRFWFFIMGIIAIWIVSFAIMNIRHALSNAL